MKWETTRQRHGWHFLEVVRACYVPIHIDKPLGTFH